MGPTALREVYPAPSERARRKTLSKLDAHCRSFISKSPFVCVGTSSDAGADVTPRGGAPGFVAVLDEATLAIPDWHGNNRLDTLMNLVASPRVGLLFLIPGVDESLRVNGEAEITTDPAMLAKLEVDGKQPRSALVVGVGEAFLHCGKALIRARLWKDDYKIARTDLPTYGQMLKDQTQIAQSAVEIEEEIADAYQNKLF